MTLSDLKDTLRAAAMSAGACAAGFARCEPVDAAVCRSYESWIGEGCHGSMAYLERYPDVRRDPALLLLAHGLSWSALSPIMIPTSVPG